MPASFEIDRGRGRVLIQLSDTVKDVDLVRMVRELWAHPDHSPAFDRLVDGSNVDRLKVSASTIESIALNWGRRRTGRIAMVGRSEAVFGLLRMYELYADDPICRTFRTLDDAVAWLDGEQPQQPKV